MPQDALKELERIRAKPVPKAEPREKPWSMGGFVENALDDAFGILKGIYQIIPSTGKAAYDILSDPAGVMRLARDPIHMARSLKDTGAALVDAVVEPYKKHGLGVVYHRPMTTLLDALTLNSMLGGSIRASGRLAGGVSGTLKPGLTAADKLVALGERIQRLPGELARKGIDAGAYKVSGGRLDLPKRREFLSNVREEAGGKEMQVGRDMELVGQRVKALTDDEAAMFHEYRTVGGNRARLDAAPRVKEAFDAYGDLVRNVWQYELGRRNLLSKGRIEGALAKKYAWEKYGSTNADDVAKARIEIDEIRKRGDVEPVYGPAIVEKKPIYSVEDFLTIPQFKTRMGNVRMLNVFKGSALAEVDPRKYVPEAIKAFRHAEEKLRLVERTLETPSLIKPRPGGVGIELPPPPPQGIYQKFFEDRTRAEAMAQITDPTTRRLLAWEFYRPGEPMAGLLRLYDRVIRLFKISGTTLNPSWYTGQVVGDAVLSVLGGSDWTRARDFMARKRLPPEVAANIGLAPGGTWLESAAQIGNSVDQATRAGLFTKALAQEMKNAGLTFEASASEMERVLASAMDFRKAQVEMRLIKEDVARGSRDIPRYDAVIARLVERERIHAARIEAMVGVLESPREAQIVARLRKLQSEQDAILKATGLSRAESKAALKELRRLAVTLPPEEVAKLATGIRRDILAPPLVERIAEGMREQFTLGKELRTAREKAVSAKAAQKESVASRASQVAAEEEVLRNIRQRIMNLGTERENILRDLAENAVKSGEWDRRLPELRAHSDLVRNAVDRANAFTGDYLGLDGFGRGVLRRIVPFYPWTRAMTMLAFRIPFLAPVKTFMWHRYSAAVMSMVGDPELPDWLSGYVPVFARENGDIVWLSLARYSPFGGLRSTNLAGVPIPSVLAFHEQNPIINVGFQFAGGRTIFQKSPLPYGESMVMIGNGDVYEFKDNGKIEKTIPQTPLISGIAHMFPSAQFLQDVLAPFVVNRYNWAGLPQPQMNSDGTYKYPREWWQRLASLFGARMIQRDPEGAKRSERLRVMKAIRGLMNSYRTGDEDERKYIREALEDYRAGEYRRIDSR